MPTISLHAASKLLNVSRATIRYYMKNGTLPYKTVERTILDPQLDLAAFEKFRATYKPSLKKA